MRVSCGRDKSLFLAPYQQRWRFRIVGDTQAVKNMGRRCQVVKRPKFILNGLKSDNEVLLLCFFALPVEQECEEFRGVAQLLGIFPELVSRRVICAPEVAAALLDLASETAQGAASKSADRQDPCLFSVRFGQQRAAVDTLHQSQHQSSCFV